MAELAGKVGAVFASSGSGTNVADETVSLDGDGIGNTTNENIWVNHIYEDDGYGGVGDEIPASEWHFTVKGEITIRGFSSVDVHVDYTYYTVAQVAGFFSWGIDKVVDALETTDFGDSGRRTYIPALEGWSATAEQHWLSAARLDSYLGTKMIIVFYIDEASGKNRYEGWGYVTGLHPAVAVDAVVNIPLDFQGTGVLSYESG